MRNNSVANAEVAQDKFLDWETSVDIALDSSQTKQGLCV